MPLRFDPASILAPGGIVSGLDDLGAAVMNAMNRRAERKYALEADARNRQRQLEDQVSSRAFQTGEREAGQKFSKELADERATRESEEQLKRDEQALDNILYADIPTYRTVERYDQTADKTYKVQEPLSPEEIAAELSARRKQAEAFENRYGMGGQRPLSAVKRFDEWASQFTAKPAAPETKAPAPSRAYRPFVDPDQKRTARIADLDRTIASKDPTDSFGNRAWDIIKRVTPGWTNGIPWSQSYTGNVTELNRLRAEQAAAALAHDASERTALGIGPPPAPRGPSTRPVPLRMGGTSFTTTAPPAATPAAKAAETLAPAEEATAPAPVAEAPAPAPVAEAPAPAPVAEAPAKKPRTVAELSPAERKLYFRRMAKMRQGSGRANLPKILAEGGATPEEAAEAIAAAGLAPARPAK